MVNFIKLLTPPLFIIIYRNISRYSRKRFFYHPVRGYENPRLIDAVIEKSLASKIYIESQKRVSMDSFRIFVAMALGNSEIKRVVDVGGASGYHYFSSRVMHSSRNLEWVVVETPLFCREAKKRNELNELTFCDNISDAFSALNHDVDLVYCSRALQYVSDPIGVLREICQASPKYIFITGIAFSPDDEVHKYSQRSELQNNGPQIHQKKSKKSEEVEYSLQLFPRKIIEDVISKDYSIELRIDEDPEVHQFDGRKIPYNGLWAVRRDILKNTKVKC